MDAITCTESDEMYQEYLRLIGAEDGFTFFCINDTHTGLSRSVLNSLNSHRMSFRRFDNVTFIVMRGI